VGGDWTCDSLFRGLIRYREASIGGDDRSWQAVHGGPVFGGAGAERRASWRLGEARYAKLARCVVRRALKAREHVVASEPW
jgi:hypothetical protein